MTTTNPFIRGYQDLYVRRELLVTYDDHFEPCYRQITAEQQDLADDQLIGHHSIFNETHTLAVEPETVTDDQHTLYPGNGQVRAVVYAVRATENGEELHLGDTETLARAQGLLKRIQFETGFYSRAFEITSSHLPDDEWDELQDLVQHADTQQLMFECFTLPDSDAVGFKLHGTPWTDEHLNNLEGFGLSTLQSHKTDRGKKLSVRTVKAPGFGPKGIHRFVLPFTVFLKLKDIGGNVLPAYQEEFVDIPMEAHQDAAYRQLAGKLTAELRQALARRDTTLLGVVLNVLLAWPDCCFRPEVVKHPRTRDTLARVDAIFDEDQANPKEEALIKLCRQEKAMGRKVLAYTVYSGTRDTTSRLKRLLEQAGLKVAVLRASVDTARREDWILDQVDRGVDVLVTNPELVKTGLDLLDFPTIVFLQTGYNVYTLQQAARRSWRIGQKQAVRVLFFGYAGSSQITCLQLMAKKIAVAQSTSGDVPESGLDALNQDGDSVEMALARQLVNG